MLSLMLLGMGLVLLTTCAPKGKSATHAASGAASVPAMLKDNHLEGRVVLVEFGTIGCQLSEQGLEAMADLKRRNAIPDLGFVRLEATGSKPVVDAYYAVKSPGFPVVQDADLILANALGTTIFPRFALLDKYGRVRYRGSMPSEKDLTDWTRRLQAETADAGPDAALLGTTPLDIPTLLCGTRLPDLSGTVKSLADYRAKQGVLLAFVDTKCPFSAGVSKEMPIAASVLAKLGFSTVIVNIGDPANDVNSFYHAGIPGAAIVYDAGKQTQQNWGVEFVPTVILLDTAAQTIYRGSPVWGDVAAALGKRLNLPTDAIRFDAQGTSQG